MDYIKIRFANDFGQLSSQIGKTVEDIFRSAGPMFTIFERMWKPPIDIYETSEEIVILAEIAGVDKENLEVEVNERAVRICGNRTGVLHERRTTYRLAEIQYGTFERILLLPATVDVDNVAASYLNGLLQIRLAKLTPGKTHRIAIMNG